MTLSKKKYGVQLFLFKKLIQKIRTPGQRFKGWWGKEKKNKDRKPRDGIGCHTAVGNRKRKEQQMRGTEKKK